jgi:hypothetical protein
MPRVKAAVVFSVTFIQNIYVKWRLAEIMPLLLALILESSG